MHRDKRNIDVVVGLELSVSGGAGVRCSGGYCPGIVLCLLFLNLEPPFEDSVLCLRLRILHGIVVIMSSADWTTDLQVSPSAR